MEPLIFWRNTSRTIFETDGEGERKLDEALAAMAGDRESALPAAVNIALEAMPWAMMGTGAGFRSSGQILVQEVLYNGSDFRACFVVSGVEQPVLGNVVGGGGDLWVRAGGRIRGEFSLYYHRLTCTNGAVLPLANQRDEFSARTIAEWKAEIEAAMPRLIERLDEGFAAMQQAARTRVRHEASHMMQILAGSGPEGLHRWELVAEAFAQEPGDTVWHLANAFSAAANILERRSGLPSTQVIAERRALQRAAMKVLRIVSGETSPTEALAFQ